LLEDNNIQHESIIEIRAAAPTSPGGSQDPTPLSKRVANIEILVASPTESGDQELTTLDKNTKQQAAAISSSATGFEQCLDEAASPNVRVSEAASPNSSYGPIQAKGARNVGKGKGATSVAEVP